ncbi:DUF805 domain-containing protein [Sphingobacterium cellulitidis]|uniref:DUF805 domain-containing protein n=1 Tax=Sphingobacterium cellulitidis TaxID=1768011 RepID=UPI003C7C1A0F
MQLNTDNILKESIIVQCPKCSQKLRVKIPQPQLKEAIVLESVVMSVIEPPEIPSNFELKYNKLFSFEGRIGRLEFFLTNLIIFFIAETLKYLFKGDKNEVWNFLENRYEDMILRQPLLIIPMVILMWISLSQGTKRCHDVGRSGWFLLIPFYIFYLIFAEGQRFDNKYGQKIK